MLIDTQISILWPNNLLFQVCKVGLVGAEKRERHGAKVLKKSCMNEEKVIKNLGEIKGRLLFLPEFIVPFSH